ncbi:ENT domain-containing protein [Psidium guajava]|nr:ENT domain-containing protein [Psidium guajava]
MVVKMAYKRGTRVEVLNIKELPSSSWRSAEIISGNGCNYMVRYYNYNGATVKNTLERVSSTAIRPCPPFLDISGNWVPGDVVEVFDSFSWKVATVSRALGKNYYLVRLLGGSQQLRVTSSDIRPRQSWQDGSWTLIGQDSAIVCEGKCKEMPLLKYDKNPNLPVKKEHAMQKLSQKKILSTAENGINLQDYHFDRHISLKRPCLNGSSVPEAASGGFMSYKGTDKEGRFLNVTAADTPTLPKQINAASIRRDTLDHETLQSSLRRRISGFTDTGTKRIKSTDADGHSFASLAKSGHNDSDECSVGSCSIGRNDSHICPRDFSASPVENVCACTGDAQSTYHWEHEERSNHLLAKENLEAEIHRLELQAYRYTMEALHASGPLSWEQEALVTNLRLSLHISNDEHLKELRKLVSTDHSF